MLFSRSVTMGGSCILLFLCFRDLGLYFVFEKSTKSSFYFRCFKLAIFEYKTIKTVETVKLYAVDNLACRLQLEPNLHSDESDMS